MDEPTPRGKAYTGARITVFYEGARCRHVAECVRGLPGVFDTRQRPWIQPGAADPEAIAEVVRRCPTGALHYRLEDGPAEHPDAPTTLTPTEHGPLFVRGDLRLDTPDGPLAETRAALCTCGRSANAPFCDGACEA
jgi:uncharacterized Fe-S cluster protein YjdI/CDGSH-type Zn-finger protein